MWNEGFGGELLFGNRRAASNCWPLSVSLNKHPYLFYWVGPKPTSERYCVILVAPVSRAGIMGSWWEVERKGTGSLPGSVWAPLNRYSTCLDMDWR